MSRIKCRDTSPEKKMLEVIRVIVGNRIKIETCRNDLPGRPDFVIPSLSLIIFVDGCFYHGCPQHGHIPKSNTKYWKAKIEANKRRDRQNRNKLRRSGYFVWTFWEHDLKKSNRERLLKKINNRIIKIKMS